MIFGPKDEFLSVCSVDGFYYEWNTYNWEKKID